MLAAGAHIEAGGPRSRWVASFRLAAILLVVVVSVAVPARANAAIESGALSQLGEPASCIGETKEEVAKCGSHVPFGLDFAYEVQVSPDGRNAYSVAVNGDLIEYSRNRANGSLSVIGCFSSQPSTEAACEKATMEVAAIESPAALAISPDGSSVYVIGQGRVNDIVEFSRDPETGLLTKIGCITHDATSTECATTEAKGLELPYGVTVSPDGENVYVASYADEAVAEFKRDTGSGQLTQLGGANDCISDKVTSECGTTSAVGLKEAIGVAVSPDGKDVYVGAGARSAEGDIAAFERGAEGTLTQLPGEEACIGEKIVECTHGASAEHIDGAEDLVVSADGNNLYATSFAANAVVELKRKPSGALEQLVSPNECVSTEKSLPNCTEAKAVGGSVGLAISPDGANVYASSASENAVASFERGSEGELTQLAGYPCVTETANGCEPATSNERIGLRYARRLTVSPDNTNLYVASQEAHAIAAFARAVKPSVSSLSNGGGPEAGGNEITIEGSGFIEGATVEFVGAGAASQVHVDSASTITAVAPPGHGAAYVVVATSSGQSSVGAGSEYVYGRLGGLNIAGYCEGLGDNGNGKGATALLRGEVEGPNYAYENWACVDGSGKTIPIAAKGAAPSMDNACAVAFPSTPSHAHADNPNNAFSWNCYEGAPTEEEKGEGSATLPPLAKLGSELVTFPLPIVVPPPVLAKTGNVAPVKGSVLIELPGSKTFVPLASLTQIPFGTVIEAANGTVSVTTANPNGTTQTGQFFGGQFILLQGKNGLVIAKLNGGNFSVCPTARERAHRASASAAALSAPQAREAASGKHVVRKLWANAHGKFSTQGNYAAGAVQGTEWLTEDLCEGTLIKVTRDKVVVTNLVNHKHVEVKAGHKSLAKAP